MGSMYLQGGDLAAFGVSGATSDDIQSASAVVDAFLQRPEGMVWVKDAAGLPCYMAALSPAYTFTAASPIAAGSGVTVPVTGVLPTNDLVGDVVILDRADPTKTEACVISGVTASGVILQTVTRTHAAGPLEGGLVIFEERALPEKRNTSRVARTPVARLIGGAGRYSYGRRSQQVAGIFGEPTILSMVQAFGGPPQWNLIDTAHTGVSSVTGEIWVPPGMLGANFVDVRFRYVAGFPFEGLPTPIKQACASVVMTLQQFPELNGNMKLIQAGGTKVERFADTLLNAETRALLGPFQAKLYF